MGAIYPAETTVRANGWPFYPFWFICHSSIDFHFRINLPNVRHNLSPEFLDEVLACRLSEEFCTTIASQQKVICLGTVLL